MLRALLVASFVLAASPLTAAEKWYDWYNRGVAAVRATNYREAADALQHSVAEMPTESTSARAGNVIITYVPHFWLGIARYNLGEVDAAIREWKTSEEQGAVQNTQYYGQLREWVSRANSQKQRNSESAASESRKAADAAMSKALAGQMTALGAGADRSDSYRAAQRKLQEALDVFNKAGTDIRAYQRATDLAGQAREMFASAAEEVKKAKAARPPAPAPAPAVVPATPPRAQPQPIVIPFSPPPPTPAPQPEPPKAQLAPPPAPAPAPVESEALVSARIAVQEYKRHLLDANLPPREAQALEKRLTAHPDEAAAVMAAVQKGEKLLAAKRAPAPAPVLPVGSPPVASLPVGGQAPPPVQPAAAAPSPLIDAYRAFAGGDLARADGLLTRLVASNATADAYLLRGCTRWTQATLRRADVKAATDDFRAALKLNRGLRLDPVVFSPKLVEFFEGVRRQL
jgi:hypothetical protein